MRWVFAFIGAIIALYLGAATVMSTAWFRGVLQREITARLHDLSGARVEIGELEFRPWVLQLTLRRLVLHGTEGPGEAPLVEAGVTVVTVNPASPFRKKLLLHRFDLEDAQIHLRTNPDGSTNLPGPAEPGTPGGTDLLDDLLDLTVGDLTVSRTAVFWNNQQIPLDLGARGVAIVLQRSRLRRQYTGSVALASLELRDQHWALPAVAFSTRVEFSRSQLALSSLTWRTAGEPPGVWGSGSLHLDRFPSLTGEASLRARGKIDVLVRAFNLTEVTGGSFDWDGHLDFSGGKLASQGRLQAHEVRIRSSFLAPGTINLTADYTATPQKVNLSKLALSAFGGSLNGRGEVFLGRPGPGLTLHADLAGISLQELFRSAPLAPAAVRELGVAAQVSGPVEASWMPQPRGEMLTTRFALRFEPPVESNRGTAAGLRPLTGSAAGTATFALGAQASPGFLEINLEHAEFQLPRSSLKAQGTIGSDQSNLRVEFATSNFEEERSEAQLLLGLPAPVPLALKSQATFSGSLRGAMASPVIVGHLRAGAFEYAGWGWDGFQGDLLASAAFSRITSGRLLAGASSLLFDLTATTEDWEVTESSAVHLIARADRTPLEGLLGALNLRYPVSGNLTGHVDLSGTESSLEGGGTIEIAKGTVEGEPFDSLSSQLRVAKSVFDLNNVEVTKGAGKITGQVKYDAERPSLSGHVHGTGFSLSGFKLLEGQELPKLGGIAAFDLEGGGTEGNLRFRSTLNVHQFTVNNSPVGDLESEGDLQGTAIRFSGGLRSAQGELHWTGRMEARADWPIQAKGRYQGLRLESLVNRLQGARFPGLIVADGSFDLAGPLRGAPAEHSAGGTLARSGSQGFRFADLKGLSALRLQVHSATDSLQVQFPSVGLAWRNDAPIEITYSGETLRVDRFRLKGPSTDFTLEGSARVGEPSSLEFQARGRADASLLSLIDPSIAAIGRFDLDFHTGGTLGQPLLFGTLTVSNLSLSYSDFPFRLAGLNGELQVEGDRVNIKTLRGSGGGGTVSLSGFATLALGGGAPHYDFRARLDQAHVEFPISFTSVLSGSLHLVGTAENGTLSGQMSIGQTFVPDNFDLLTWINRVIATFAPHPGTPPPFGGKVRLDVQVASDPEVRVESRNLTAVLDVNTRLQGTLADPVVFGGIHIVSGEAKLRGNDYRATRGDISFANPFRTEPSVDIEATTRVQQYDLTLDVSGPLEDARLSYRSQPPMAAQDILTLLALGYSQSQAAVGVSGTQQSFGTLGASALLSQALSTQVSSRIQRLFGVSQISINPNVGGPMATSGSTLTVVERPARDFTITYSTNTSNSVQRIIQMEWDLTDRLSVIGVRDQNGVLGFELRTRRSFR